MKHAFGKRNGGFTRKVVRIYYEFGLMAWQFKKIAVPVRPRFVAPTVIVDINELMNEEAILNESLRLGHLWFENKDKLDILKWFARHGLIRNSYLCAICNMQTSLVKCGDISDGYNWHCKVKNY